MTTPGVRSATTDPASYVPGGPEALFHVRDVTEAGGVSVGTMDTGPWTLGPDGRPAFGSLGVALDVVMGAAAIADRPAGSWAVTTEILVDTATAIPTDGSPLSIRGSCVHRDRAGALAQGSVEGQDGRLVAVATTRVRYTPGLPAGANALPADFVVESSRPVLDMLGVERSGDALTLATTARTSNPMGNFHGGVALCLADIAGRAALRTDDHPLDPASLDTASLHIVYVRPGPLDGHVRIVAEPAHRGRTLAAVHVHCLRPDGKPFALATITYQ